MIIKAARLQAWTLTGEGKSRSSPPPPPQIKNKKKFFDYIGGLFATFSSYGGLFATFFSFLEAFLLLFTSWWEPFLGFTPPPTKISAGAHDCNEGSRACSPEMFLYDRNLVSSGHVLSRFCLKNDKNSDKL